jgi:stage II sporulation protein AB (anti-sigma F factor)
MRTCVESDVASTAASELRLPARPSQLSVARQYAAEAAAAFGLDADSRYEFVYAVNEAVTNAIRHGAPDEQGLICLSIVADAHRLTFAVRDYGTFVIPVSDAATRMERGRGLALMADLVDEVELRAQPGNTTVSLSKVQT